MTGSCLRWRASALQHGGLRKCALAGVLVQSRKVERSGEKWGGVQDIEEEAGACSTVRIIIIINAR